MIARNHEPTAIERKIARHLRKDYTQAAGVLRLGLSEPVAIVRGKECLVRCKDAEGYDVCVSMEEAIGRDWMPTLEEIYGDGGLAQEARQMFRRDEVSLRTGARHGWFGKRSDGDIAGIRVVAMPCVN